MQGKILFKISLSNIMANKGKRHIGRYDEGRSGGLLDLRKIIMVENFQSSEKYASLSAALNLTVS